MRVEEGIAIGELSRRTGVNIETIRYYERVGLVEKPPRTHSGRRVYGIDHVRTFALIRRSRELGFTPAEVRAILSLVGAGEASCTEVREIAAHHLEGVRAKMADLAHLESLLASTIERCEGDGAATCAVLEMLEETPKLPRPTIAPLS
jgi:MerR family mercuric resistance operon transcriptional regulator